MKNNVVKVLFIIIFSVSFLAVLVFGGSFVQTFSSVQTDLAAEYKTKCQACHTARAEKFFDPAKGDAVLIETILKGIKGEKPPFMPGFESKGMTAEQAGKLIEYMKQLRMPKEANSGNMNANMMTNAAACNCNCNCQSANTNVETNSPVNANVAENVTTVPDETAISAATAAYKTKCQACHTAKAAKFFDGSKADEQLIEAILKGKKGDKPPFMPGFEANGMNREQAKTLVFYMRQLKNAGQ